MEPAEAVRASRRRVAGALGGLTGAHGTFDRVDERWDVDAEAYHDYVDRVARGTLGGAGTWTRDDAGRVLLVRDVGADGWSEPCGRHEPGETLAGTARRETREETGLEVRLDGVALVQHLRIVPPEPVPHDPIHRVLAVFTARPVGGTLRPREGEIAAVDWFAALPDRLRYEALGRLPAPGGG